MAPFLFVHGLFHGGWCWDRSRHDLEERGHTTLAVDLPMASLGEDAAVVREAIMTVDRPIVVGHSYGGLVISRAITPELDVARLIYVAAVLVDGNDSLVARMGNFPGSQLAGHVQPAEDGWGTVTPEGAVITFYNACSAADANDAAGRLRPARLAIAAEQSDHDPWRSIPSTYVLCERDHALPPACQRWMAERSSELVSFDTDHSPFLSMPERFVDLLDGVASGVSRTAP